MISDYHPDSTQFSPSEAGSLRPRNRATRGVIQVSSNPRTNTTKGVDVEAIRGLANKGGARRTGEHPVVTAEPDLRSIRLAPQARTRERSDNWYNRMSGPKKALVYVGAIAVGAGLGWGLGKLSEDNPTRDELDRNGSSVVPDQVTKVDEAVPGNHIVVEGSSNEQPIDVAVGQLTHESNPASTPLNT